MTPEEALNEAVKVCGSATALARVIGIRSQAVSQWKRCPAGRVLAVEAATSGRVSRHDLRPDLYPREEAA